MSTILYRASDGRTDYGFSMVRLRDGKYHAYITHQPPYGERDPSLTATHRGRDERGFYVKAIRAWTLEAAREVAARWAEANQQYLATGRWEWNVDVSPRNLGIVRKVFANFAFARDFALRRDVLLLAKFAPAGFAFRPNQRITYSVVVDERGRGLQAREIRPV